jgi:hypothetical protein
VKPSMTGLWTISVSQLLKSLVPLLLKCLGKVIKWCIKQTVQASERIGMILLVELCESGKKGRLVG